MDERDENKKSSYIRERIVPKKNAKKVLLTIVGVVAAALIFGVVAGVAFSVSRNLFGRETAPTESQIIILPRGGDESEGEDLLMPETESTSETEPAPETEPGPTEEAPSTEQAETAEPTEPEPVTLKSVYSQVSKSLVRVTLVLPAGEDWFNEPQTSRKETFGVPVYENDEELFLMTDANDFVEGSVYHVILGRQILVMEPYAVDFYTKIAMLRISKDLLQDKLELLPFGGTTNLSLGERVFLIGTIYGGYVGVDEGRLTYIAPREGVMDGYRQLFYTNMNRAPGSTGILVNEAGELIGWMSDVSAGTESGAVVMNIQSVKNLMLRMSRGEKGALLGVCCRALTGDDVSGTNRENGVYVESVMADSPAFAAGLQVGDRLISMNGQNLISNWTLQAVMETQRPGNTLTILVGRMNNGEEEQLELRAVLTER